MKSIITLLLIISMIACQESNEVKSNQTENINSILDKKQEVQRDTVYQDDEFLMIANRGVKVDVIRKNDKKEIQSEGDTLFTNDYVTFLGDIDDEPEIFIKYKSRYKFEDFPVKVYTGKLSEPDFSTDEDAKRFTTRITAGSKKPPNFAGKLNFISWGCGTNCQSSAILNSETGEIYEGLVTGWGVKAMEDSKLLISDYGLFEDRENEWLPFCGFCIPEFYVWNWKEKKLIKLE